MSDQLLFPIAGTNKYALGFVSVDPATGSPTVPGGTGGGASIPPVMAVIDSAIPAKRWVMLTDYSAMPAIVAFYEFGTNNIGTPTLPVLPDNDADSATVANQLIEIARLEAIRDRLPETPHAQPLTNEQLRDSAVLVTGNDGPVASLYSVYEVRDRLPASFLTPGLLPVDTLGTAGLTWHLSATSAASSPVVITATVRRVSIDARVDCWVRFGGAAAVVAVGSSGASIPVAAGAIKDFDVPANTTVSVLCAGTADGSVFITELV